MCFLRFFGIEWDGYMFVYDFLLLLVFFFYRYLLKVRLLLVFVCRINSFCVISYLICLLGNVLGGVGGLFFV